MGFRKVQKGKPCKVVGCEEWCKSNDLCHKHNMALRRYGNVLGGKVDRVEVCKNCGEEFKLIKSNQEYCDLECYRKSPQGKAAAYQATRDYRIRNKEKLNARGIFRSHPLKKDDNCLVCNTKDKLHRHHHNYKNRLDVTILCNKHHHELHSWDSN